MSKRFSAEEMQEIRELREQGWTYAKLQTKYHCGSSVLHTFLDKYVRIKDRFSEEDKQKIKELRERGMFYTQLAILYNVQTPVIKDVYKSIAKK